MPNYGSFGNPGQRGYSGDSNRLRRPPLRVQFILCRRVAWHDVALCTTSGSYNYEGADQCFHITACRNCWFTHSGTGERSQYSFKLDFQLYGGDGHRTLFQRHKLEDIYRYVHSYTSLNDVLSMATVVFAALNAFIIPVVYFFFPETAGRSLEGE